MWSGTFVLLAVQGPPYLTHGRGAMSRASLVSSHHRTMRALATVALVLGLAVVVSAQHKIPPLPDTAGKPKKLASGVTITDIKLGTGVPAEKGRMVRIYFTGWVSKSQVMFDYRDEHTGPLAFRLGLLGSGGLCRNLLRAGLRILQLRLCLCGLFGGDSDSVAGGALIGMRSINGSFCGIGRGNRCVVLLLADHVLLDERLVALKIRLGFLIVGFCLDHLRMGRGELRLRLRD